jgi:MATE family multidrug resistance protein
VAAERFGYRDVVPPSIPGLSGLAIMTSRTVALKQEVRPMLRLALPVVLAEIGWVAMGVIDVMMVGRIDAESIGAVSVGRAAFFVVAIFGIGLLLGLDTLVSQAYGAGYLSLAMTAPLMLVARAIGVGIGFWGIDPGVHAQALPYLAAVSWSALPVFLYATFRRYLQAINLVRPVMIALLSANVVNVIANWILIFGKLGAPALGAVGAGWRCFTTGRRARGCCVSRGDRKRHDSDDCSVWDCRPRCSCCWRSVCSRWQRFWPLDSSRRSSRPTRSRSTRPA